MSGNPKGRESLAEAIAGIDGDHLAHASEHARDACLRAADAVLASDWLTSHVAAHVTAALNEAAAEAVQRHLEDEWHETQCACDGWPRGCVSGLKGREPWSWDPGAVLSAAALLARTT